MLEGLATVDKLAVNARKYANIGTVLTALAYSDYDLL